MAISVCRDNPHENGCIIDRRLGLTQALEKREEDNSMNHVMNHVMNHSMNHVINHAMNLKQYKDYPYNRVYHGTRVVKWASLKSWCFGFAGSNPARDTCSYSSVG